MKSTDMIKELNRRISVIESFLNGEGIEQRLEGENCWKRVCSPSWDWDKGSDYRTTVKEVAIGQRVVIGREEYILANMGVFVGNCKFLETYCALISLTTGNRWKDPVKVKVYPKEDGNRTISFEDFQKIGNPPSMTIIN